MAGRVQEFVTIRIGSLWVDVPMGPAVSNNASSLDTTAASPAVVAQDQEVDSKPEEGFTPVTSKAAKRRARRVAAKARMASNERATNWRKAAPVNKAAPTNVVAASSSKPSSSKVARSFRPATLGEWPVCTKRASPAKSTSLMASSSSTAKAKGGMTTPTPPTINKLGACPPKLAPGILGAAPTKIAPTTNIPPPSRGIVLRDSPQNPQPSNKEKASISKGKAGVIKNNLSSNLDNNPSHSMDQEKMFMVGGNEILVTVTSSTTTVEHFLRDVRSKESKALIVGLDTEWFEWDRKKIALIQICVGKKCLLFKVGHAGIIPDDLKSFLADENHVFVGVAIANDLDRLREGHQVELSNKIELQAMVPFIIPGKHWDNVPSLATLAQVLLGVSVEGKGTALRYKEWDNELLTDDQIKYASTDVVVPYMIGEMLQNEYGCNLHFVQSPNPSSDSSGDIEDIEDQHVQLCFIENQQTKRIHTCPACPACPGVAKRKNWMWNEAFSHAMSQAFSEKEGTEEKQKLHKQLLRNHGFHASTSDDDRSNPKDRVEIMMVESTSSSESDSSTKSRLRAEAPEFIPTMVCNPSYDQPKHELRWQGIHLSLNDIKRGYVDPAATLSDPISSEVALSRPSAQASVSPKRHRQEQHNILKSWDDFSNELDSMTDAQRAHVCDSLLAQQKREYHRIRNAARQAFQASIERTICQDLRKLLPGVSASSDNIEGEIMRRAETLAKSPEYQEFIKKDSRRKKYAKQAANVRAKRASLKERELAIPTNSTSSRVQGETSSTPTGDTQNEIRIIAPRLRSATTTPYQPPHKRVVSNRFEVFSSMPVGVEEEDCNTSDASSASTHFKRKKPRNQIPLGHRPVTRSQTSSGNLQNHAIYVGSYNPLFNDHSNIENELLDTAGSTDPNPPNGEDPQAPSDIGSHSSHNESEPSEAEQVLATNDGQSVQEQMNQMMAALQQKEEELAALREQVTNARNNTNGANASTSQNDPPPHPSANQDGPHRHPQPEITLESIQRMISEGVKAQYMQTHYSMRPGYVKPYPPEVDMIPFPSNYRQPQFSKFNGTGSPHEHVAHFLAACQDTAHNGALLLRQFVQTLSGPAFTWYSKLAPGSVRTWEQMQDAFLERFYSTQRMVGITELTQTMQRPNEKAADFINRWRNLSLHCPQPITEPEAVRMCMNNLSPDMAIHLQGVRPITFEELSSKATDIENYMHHLSRPPRTFNKAPLDKSNPRDKPTSSKPKQVQAMEATMAPRKFQPGGTSTRMPNKEGAPAPRRPTLSERQNQKYSFPVEEVDDLFMGLRELGLIELPKPKRPEEASKFDDPNFCHYHRILGHTLKDCFVVKNLIQKLIDEGTLDADQQKDMTKGKKTATSNVATFQNDLVSRAAPKIGPSYDQYMISKPEHVNVSFSGYPKQQAECQHEGKTFLRWIHSPKGGPSSSQRSGERRQQLSRRFALRRMMEKGEGPRFYQNIKKREADPLEKYDAFPIGMFEDDDDESLHFPEEETLEVDEVQLRSGRQLPRPSPQQRNPPNVTPSDVTDHVPNVSVKYDVISHLKKIPAMLSVYDALCLSSDLRKAFITALSFPEDYRVEVSQAEVKLARAQSITFSDEDLLLGNTKHNRPLFMLGEIDDLPINRIMIDGGSAINLLPMRTLKKIGYSKGDLCHSNVVIHGFNQSGQEALGTICLVLKFESFTTYVKFYVIDAATSYNALIGRPWLHENKVIPSTLHQCIKYKDPSGDIIRIFADKKPFTTAETFYADAKFYFEHVDKVSKPKPTLPLEENIPKIEVGETTSSKKVYRYIPNNQRKKGDPIFRIINKKPSQNRGTSFPTPLPPLVQYNIKQAQSERDVKIKGSTQITLLNKDDQTLPISLYDDKILYIMQQMGYDISTGPSLCDGRGQLAPFEKLLSQAQLNALHQDEVLKEEKYGLGYEVNMTSTEPLDATEASPQMEDGNQPTTDELEEINIGTDDDPRPIFISKRLSKESKKEYHKFLSANKDIFAWSYEEMPGLDPMVAEHKLAVRKDVTPVKQGQRRYRPELLPQIEAEVDKLIAAGFIREVKYPKWVSSIVPVKKKNGKIRVCVDFRDLNKACPKDEFPIPISEILIDATMGYEIFSFMDGFSGYNQIKMSPEDEELTAFRTPKGIFCYKVMPFGLKNAGATYQRAMAIILDGLLYEIVECYIDDIVVKSKREKDHLKHLEEVFTRLRKHKLKMNPMKCAFGVSSGKFLGFVVTKHGVEIDPTKIKTIVDMPRPTNLHELKSLQGHLAYIRRFISNLSGRCKPFSRLMKKGVPFQWDQACQNAFDDIKKYLTNPPVLCAPIKGRPLILYTAAMPTSLGALLAQTNDEGKEVSLYYLSRTLLGAECNYPDIEKICLALVFAAQKLRHYMLEHTVHLVSRADPLRHILSKMTLSGRLAKWAMILSQFDIVFVPQKAVKGQALANFLAAHPIPDDFPIDDDLPDEEAFTTTVSNPTWQMYFDGACRKSGAGAGVVFVTPDEAIFPYSFTLTSAVSNNAAEYEALIIGLEIAHNMGLNTLSIYGDSQLIVNQLLGTYTVKKEGLVPYFKKAKELMTRFADLKIQHVVRSQNEKADALASLAASMSINPCQTMDVHVEERRVLPVLAEEENILSTSAMTIDTCEIEMGDWRTPFLDYLLHGYLPLDSSQRSRIRKRSINYTCINDTLYRRSCDGILLRCLAGGEIIEALKEVHSGVCGAHQSGPKLHYQLKHLGYYWPTMFVDSMEFAKKCHECQIHGNFIHQPHEPLHPTNMSWPFEMWGMDVVGPINPPSSKGHRFILAATDYFSKWAEAIALKEVKAENVENFIRTNLIYRFGVPARIISDNGTNFKNRQIEKMCAKFKIKHHFSTGYNPSANGQAEAFNKVLCKLLKKVVSQNKRHWHEKLLETLWAYRTTTRTPTKMTPYSLVYGGEAVLPLEVQIASLRVAIREELNEDEPAKLRLKELDNLEEKRLQALQNLEAYQARMSRAFDKCVKRRSFKEGDLVLAVIRPMNITHKMQSKFEPKWEGPYIVKDVYSSGAYRIISPDGEYYQTTVNGKFLKRYYE